MIVRIINPREGSGYRANVTPMRYVCSLGRVQWVCTVVAYANYCLRAIQLATTIFRANNGPGDEKQTNKKRRKRDGRPVTLSPSLPPLHPLFFVSLSSFLLSHFLFCSTLGRHRCRLRGLPHAMLATLLPAQLLSSVSFINNSRVKQRFREWQDHHGRITSARGRGDFSSDLSRLRAMRYSVRLSFSFEIAIIIYNTISKRGI